MSFKITDEGSIKLLEKNLWDENLMTVFIINNTFFVIIIKPLLSSVRVFSLFISKQQIFFVQNPDTNFYFLYSLFFCERNYFFSLFVYDSQVSCFIKKNFNFSFKWIERTKKQREVCHCFFCSLQKIKICCFFEPLKKQTKI